MKPEIDPEKVVALFENDRLRNRLIFVMRDIKKTEEQFVLFVRMVMIAALSIIREGQKWKPCQVVNFVLENRDYLVELMSKALPDDLWKAEILRIIDGAKPDSNFMTIVAREMKNEFDKIYDNEK